MHILETKLMYGLEALQLPQSAVAKLNVFQSKGLRKILRMGTTYVNRGNTNEEVYRRAKRAMQLENEYSLRRIGRKMGIVKLSERYQLEKLKFYADIVAMEGSGGRGQRLLLKRVPWNHIFMGKGEWDNPD